MNFKPNEFFIGLVEFVTILLPGAVMALIILVVEANLSVKGNHVMYQYAFSEDTELIQFKSPPTESINVINLSN